MSVLSHMLGQKSNDPIQRLTDEFYTYQIAENIGSRLFPEDKDDLQMEAAKLDIELKRRQLGLPMTDEYYEMATNENKPFVNSGVQAVWGRKLGNAIPNPVDPAHRPSNLSFFGTLGHTPNKFDALVTRRDIRGGVKGIGETMAAQISNIDAMTGSLGTKGAKLEDAGGKGLLRFLRGIFLKK